MTQIAVVSMAGRFPGGLDSPESFWQALMEGRDLVGPVPPSRWNADRYDRPQPDAGMSGAGRWGGFIEDVDLFDPTPFGISPREAETMDPAQRLLLEAAWRCGEAAGQRPTDWAGRRIGVYIGAFTQDYFLLQLGQRKTTIATSHTATGAMQTLLSNRISYCFRLTGPSMTVDTACSSSLVALHLAVQSLTSGESEAALVGGAQLQLSPYYTAIEQKGGFLSPDGRCRSFDHRANGYVRAEAVGMVLLMPLDRALAGRLPIRAVIHGTAVNHNGRPIGITLPNAEAQSRLIRETLARAQVTPDEIGYVECHGTGTRAGDQAEITALGETLGRNRTNGPLFIGTAKVNLGHAEAAAGVTGLIRAILCLENRTIPPHLHFEREQEGYELAPRGLRLALKAEPWPGEASFAAINSFGFGGANAHVVIGPPPPYAADHRQPGPAPSPTVLFLSGPTELHVQDQATAYRDFLTALPSEADLQSLTSASLHQRDQFAHRLVMVSPDRAALHDALKDYAVRPSSPGWIQGGIRDPSERRLAWICTGMGPQWRGMGQGLARRFPVFHDEFTALADEYAALTGQRIDLFHEAPSDEGGLPAETAQPLNLFLQISLGRLLIWLGIEPDVLLGHSVGEVAAFHLAGAIHRTTALQLIFHRSRLQGRLAGQGGMTAVGADAGTLAPLLERHGLCLAAANGPSMLTVAGPAAGLAGLEQELTRAGLHSRRLPVEIAYHSRAMDALEAEFRTAICGLAFSTPFLPLVSSVTGRLMDKAGLNDFAGYWFRNMRAPVSFWPAAETCRAQGARVFQEIGAHPVLRVYLRALGEPTASLGTLRRDRDDVAALVESLATLHVHGLAPEWEKLFPPPAGPVPLPGFVWRKSRFWSEAPEKQALRLAQPDHPLLGYRRDGSEWIWDCDLADQPAWGLRDHDVLGQPRCPAAVFVEMLDAAHRLIAGGRAGAILDLAIHSGLRLPETGETRLTTMADDHTGRIAIRDGEGQVLVEARFATIPNLLRPYEADGELPDTLSAEEFYASAHRLGFRYGPAFRCIDKITFDTERCCVQIAGGPLPGFTLPPAVLDGALQALLAHETALCGAAAQPALRLPVAIGEVVIRRAPATDDFPLTAWTRQIESNASQSIGDVVLRDRRGRLVAELKRVSMRALVVPSAFAAGRDVSSALFTLDWRPVVQGPSQEHPAREWLILSTGSEPLADGLRTRNFVVAESNEDAIPQVLGESHSRPRCIVDLTLLTAEGGAGADQATILAAARRYGELTRLGRERDEIWIVTRGAHGTSAASPLQKSAWGMARALIDAEKPSLWRGIADVGEDPAADWADAVIDLILANPRESEFRLSSEGWMAPRLSACSPSPKAPLWLREDATYLVTGAFGALGRLTAQFLVDHGARHLVLLGSGRMPAERNAPWVRALQQRGVSVLADGFDLAESGAWRVFRGHHARSGMPPIRGAVHSAGTTVDRALADTRFEDFRKVLGPKVAGVHNLLATLNLDGLDFLVFYSSISGLLPAYGQSAYAAANLYLDSLAGHLAAQGVPARSVAWGPWTIGMAARSGLTDLFRKGGLVPFSEQEGYQALAAAFQASPAQILCAAMDWAALGTTRPRRLWLFNPDLMNGVRAAGPVIARDLAGLTPDQLTPAALADLISVAGQVMRIAACELSGRANLSTLGLDSLMAVEVQMMIAAKWGCDLDLAELMGREPLDSLADLLVRNFTLRSGADFASHRETTVKDLSCPKICNATSISRTPPAA